LGIDHRALLHPKSKPIIPSMRYAPPLRAEWPVRFAQSRPVKPWARPVSGTEGSWISVQRHCKCGGHRSVHRWKHSSRTLASCPGGHSPAGVVFEYKVCEQRRDFVVHGPVKVHAGQGRVYRPIACSCVLGLPPGRSPLRLGLASWPVAIHSVAYHI